MQFEYSAKTGQFLMSNEIVLNNPLAEVFSFFSEPKNLEILTPPFLKFRVVNPELIEMKAGALINYKLRVHALPLSWTSEITVWDPPNKFVDVQRKGPYRYWIHEHRFEPIGSQTKISDHIKYSVFGGRVIERLFVRRDIEKVFAYRQKKIGEIFELAGAKEE